MSATDEVKRTSVVSEPVDVRDFRYPTEPSRFVLATVCTLSGLAVVIVWLAQLDPSTLLTAVIGLAIAMAILWGALQVHRVRILGDAVLVTSQTFPDLQQAIDEVRDRVDYHRRVDIFVVPKLTTPAQLTSYFGVRVLLVEGGAVADITAPANRPQLLFLLGTFFGALKAKHDRWVVAEILIDNAGLRKILAPFVGPWLRATVYTGDQIAYACSRDLGTSLDAVFRTLVGRELSPQLEAAGLIKQAQRVRESLILRFSQLFRPVPHSTNRFLNLLRFAQRVQPESVARFRAVLPEATTTSLDTALERAARDERRRVGAAVMTCVAVAAGALMIYAGFMAGNALNASPGDVGDVVVDPTPIDPTPTPSEPTPQPTPTPTETTPTLAQMLIDAVPASLGGSCMEIAAPSGEFVGLSAAVTCFGLTAEDADHVDVYQFDSYDSMSAATDSWLGDLASGACVDGLRDTWTDDNVYRGSLACYIASDGESVAVWTIDDEAILIVAADPTMGLDELYTWWQQATPASLLY
ncbi:MAG TPA: hypothetical protein VJ644_08605 [Jiangellaceae bacterium]|nr:hypothetical protein [Jiangellaceae bacterium]